MKTKVIELLEKFYGNYSLIYMCDVILLINHCSEDIDLTLKMLSELEFEWLKHYGIENSLLYNEVIEIIAIICEVQ